MHGIKVLNLPSNWKRIEGPGHVSTLPCGLYIYQGIIQYQALNGTGRLVLVLEYSLFYSMARCTGQPHDIMSVIKLHQDPGSTRRTESRKKTQQAENHLHKQFHRKVPYIISGKRQRPARESGFDWCVTALLCQRETDLHQTCDSINKNRHFYLAKKTYIQSCLCCMQANYFVPLHIYKTIVAVLMWAGLGQGPGLQGSERDLTPSPTLPRHHNHGLHACKHQWVSKII